MEQTFQTKLSDAEMEAEIERMQAQISSGLLEIKAERRRGDMAWREVQRLSASNARMLDEIGDILRAARD